MIRIFLSIMLFAPVACLAKNPIMAGADPHVIYLDNSFWMYPTDAYSDENSFFVYSSVDGIDWKRQGPILQFAEIDWIGTHHGRPYYAWAPCIIEKENKFYFYYSVGPQSRHHPARIGVAVGSEPRGPFVDSGKPLLTGGNGFEAIDPMVFEDPITGKFYFYAGGSDGAKLRVFELGENMVSFKQEIHVKTPPNFTEGAFMHYYNGFYYLSYSHGSWKDASYSVHYATSSTPTGPWKYRGRILASDTKYKGPGHHSFVQVPQTGQWLMFYHRWENEEGNGPYRGNRKLAAETISYSKTGLIKPITMTDEGPFEKSLKPDNNANTVN